MNIKGYDIEFIEDIHKYVVDGILLPSVTQILNTRFGHKYDNVDYRVLNAAAKRGTAVHKAIEEYEKQGIETDDVELRNYKFLKRLHQFECLDNEIPIIIFDNDIPVACGTTDMLIKQGEKIGLADIKRTSKLDKEYLAYQLNLYRIGYQQCYDANIEILRALHLREDVRKFIDIPVNESIAWDLIREYMKGKENEEQTSRFE